MPRALSVVAAVAAAFLLTAGPASAFWTNTDYSARPDPRTEVVESSTSDCTHEIDQDTEPTLLATECQPVPISVECTIEVL